MTNPKKARVTLASLAGLIEGLQLNSRHVTDAALAAYFGDAHSGRGLVGLHAKLNDAIQREGKSSEARRIEYITLRDMLSRIELSLARHTVSQALQQPFKFIDPTDPRAIRHPADATRRAVPPGYGFDHLEQRLDKVSEDINDLDGDIATMNQNMVNVVGGLKDRLKDLEGHREFMLRATGGQDVVSFVTSVRDTLTEMQQKFNAAITRSSVTRERVSKVEIKSVELSDHLAGVHRALGAQADLLAQQANYINDLRERVRVLEQVPVKALGKRTKRPRRSTKAAIADLK